MKRFLAAILATCVASQADAACFGINDFTPDPPLWTRQQCPVRCVVRDNPGGDMDVFLRSAHRLKREHRFLAIDGNCISACTIAADKARPNVCITPRARFGFHRAYTIVDDRVVREDIHRIYSRDIQTWIAGHGGLPGIDACDDSLLFMSSRQARRFFPMCGGTS